MTSDWIAGERPEDGQLRRIGEDRYEFRIERVVPRPAEKIWAALTLPERIADWLGAPAEADLRVGGKYIVWFPGHTNDRLEGTITAFDPPRLLAYDWDEPSGDHNIRWEIEPSPAGCRLVFTQTCLRTSEPGIDAAWLLGRSAGWHAFLDDLGAAIEGRSAPDEDSYRTVDARYRRHFGPYVPGFDRPPALRHHEAHAFVTAAGPGFYTARYTRRYMLPIEAVWAALTEPERIADWFAMAEIDLRVGGMLELSWPTHGHTDRHVILELEPPKLMVWGPADGQNAKSVVRWELYQEDPKFLGTRLVLTNTLIPAEHLLSVATGWHMALHDLADDAARAVPEPWTAEREQARSLRERAELVDRYRTRLPRQAAEQPWTH